MKPEKISPSSNLYSHPDKLLEAHLIGVSRLADLFLSEKPVNIKKELTDIVRIITLVHDIGKATRYFQDYLFADEKEKEKLKTEEARHSQLSAVCSYYLTKEIHADGLYPLFSYITVKRHHGNLIDIMDEFSQFNERDADILRKQLDSIDDTDFEIVANKLHSAGLPLLLDKNVISQWINGFGKETRAIKKTIRKLDGDFKNYLTLNLLYSLLLDADKSEVVVKDISVFERKHLDYSNLVDKYLKTVQFPPSPLNDMRKMAYEEVTSNDININRRIYSINLPTGLGKTLTALSFALKLKDKLSHFENSPRIIYSLPFLSIIDQNSKVFETVIKENNIVLDTNILLKHHHLSDIYYKTSRNEFEPDEAKILIEGWNSEIIVTTFVQLFHTIISNRNRSMRKFHRLANSIIILDEVQSVPVKYWLLMKTVLTEIAKTLNVYIIFSTATQPLIFSKEETTELVDRNHYFKSLDRISLIPALDTSITIEELADERGSNDESCLFIFNTITSARKFYRLINGNGRSMTYLSTHIVPKERLNRIIAIKQGKYKIVVSTQLVEAGVDIDFENVVRDMAPLDCINQSAGRCNRNGKGMGVVKVISLKDDRDKKYSSYVYDAVLLNITEKILSKEQKIRESNFLSMLEDYYMMTHERTTQASAREILEAVCGLRYDRVEGDEKGLAISDFSLIDNDYPKRDVFIEVDEDAQRVWKKYQKLRNIKDRFLRKQAFDDIKSDFYLYIVSIPANTKNIPQLIGEIGYVKKSLLHDYYDRETGFIIKDDKSTVIW